MGKLNAAEIERVERYAIAYVQLHYDVRELSAVEFVEKVVEACAEIEKKFHE